MSSCSTAGGGSCFCPDPTRYFPAAAAAAAAAALKAAASAEDTEVMSAGFPGRRRFAACLRVDFCLTLDGVQISTTEMASAKLEKTLATTESHAQYTRVHWRHLGKWSLLSDERYHGDPPASLRHGKNHESLLLVIVERHASHDRKRLVSLGFIWRKPPHGRSTDTNVEKEAQSRSTGAGSRR
ncbi:hypothetical protein EYF80_018741 [Liparis tanakae]|uniref:Uncharacterized protein n=1 Tax=Liparis tanakae TaxID=230148 RepID=A0A4Z2HZV0_9TELE|nr:hypothetical protein EYF80_018741 [Liparis tanakae]